MSRAAASEAQGAQATAGQNAATAGQRATADYGTLAPQAQSLINSQGYDPATLGAITNAGMGGVSAAFSGAGNQIQRNAARTNNPAGVTEGLDALATNKGIAGGQEAGDIQIQNANFQNQQRTQGLNLLNSLYGTNTNAQLGQQSNQTQNINSQIAASPGWVQNLTAIGGTVAGLGKAATNAYKASQGGGGGGAA